MSNLAGDADFPIAINSIQTSLANLSTVKSRMDDIHNFLTASIGQNQSIGEVQMDVVKSEIASAIRQIIVNGSSIIACTQSPNAILEGFKSSFPDLKFELFGTEVDVAAIGGTEDGGGEIVEIDAVELLAEQAHFCEICGKRFKRDANLRMHMRAHGDQFKTVGALCKRPPEAETSRPPPLRAVRFSCPYNGCNRNKRSEKFKSLNSVTCLKNHFKRCHCPKKYVCYGGWEKSFSIAADLKSHLQSCTQSKMGLL